MKSFLLKTFFEYTALGLTIAYSVIWPLKNGMSFAQVGVIQAVLFITALLFEIPTGLYADKFGRKNSLIIGLIFSSVGMLIISTGYSYPIFILGALVVGLSRSFSSGAEESYINDMFTDDQIKLDFKKNFSKVNISREFALFVGSILSSFLAYLFDIQIIFQLAFVLTTLSLLVVVFALPKDISGNIGDKPISHKNKVDLYKAISRYKSFLLIFVTLALLFESARIIWQPHLVDIGWPQESLGVIFAFLRIFSILGIIISQKIFATSSKMIYLSSFFGGLLLLMFVLTNKYLSILFLGGYLFFESFTRLHQSNFLISIAPDKQLKSTFLSAANFIKNLSLSISGPMLIFMTARNGIYIVFFVLFLIKIFSIVILDTKLKQNGN